MPTSGIAEGTIYAKGPTYAADDTSNNNPIYRLWVYAWKGNTLAWQDNGEFQSIAAGIVQETGSNENVVMSQKATTEAIHGILYDVSAHNGGAVFESLQALLSSSNLSTLIPTSVRHGGMTIRFIQSSVSNSDNKYVHYRLTADDWSTDTEDWAIAYEGIYVENPEFVYVKTDNEGKILWAIKIDGDIYYGAGCPQQVKNYIEEKISSLSLDEYEDIVAFLSDYLGSDTTLKVMIDNINKRIPEIIGNPKFLEVTTDLEDKVLEGIQHDGTKVIGGDLNVGGDVRILGNTEVSGVLYKAIENPKFIEAETDSEGKLLAGRTSDGAAFEKVGFSTPKISIEGHTIKNIEDPEGRTEITTDYEGKVISYRDKDGVKHEKVGIETDNALINHLNLTSLGMTEFQQALKSAGFRPGGTGDWSDYISNDGESPLDIAIPRCAHLNLLTDFNLIELKKAYYTGAIKGVNYDIPIYVEFFDMQGNYFKKKAFISGQGRSTMDRDKKNIAVDFFDSEWDGAAFKVRFGNWVPQDSFHLKAYVNETFNGNGAWAYKIYDEMSKSWGVEYDYLWKRALLDMSLNTSIRAYGTTPADNAKFEDTGAKCFPDGFPCIVYQNGKFWGVFAWQIKKHRDNYKLKSRETKHIHLDGILDNNVWNTNGTPEWWSFEVRNPKNIVYSSAHLDSETGKYTYKYNADLAQENIAGNNKWSDVHTYGINNVVEHDGKRFISLQGNNVGNDPLTSPTYWNLESSTAYDTWVSGVAYPQNKVLEHNGHKFINTIADNIAEPVIDSENNINTDKEPDFKNKTKCGWINCTNTIKVKNYIIDMSKIMTPLYTLEVIETSNNNIRIGYYAGLYNAESNFGKGTWVFDGEGNYYMSIHSTNTGHSLTDINYWIDITSVVADIKTYFETRFDVNNLVDYLIINDIINNEDAFASNWQWFTYDGVKWWCGLYDCNISFGYGGGQVINADFRPPLTNHAGNSSNYMMKYIKNYYRAELEARYNFLRTNKVITPEKIYYDIVLNWINSVGYANYTKEREKWFNEVSIDNIFRLKKWIYETIDNLDILYNYNQINL